jgi:hypothetical protein
MGMSDEALLDRLNGHPALLGRVESSIRSGCLSKSLMDHPVPRARGIRKA